MKLLLKIIEHIGVFCYKKGYWLISQAAQRMQGGEHPKHRIMRYHEFFTENVKPQETVLDVGCGHGYVAWHVANKAKKVVGIDIKKFNIKDAKQRYNKENLSYITGDATTYPFKTTFDVIILSNVLEHIKHRPALLKKLPKAKRYLIRVPLITRDWLAPYLKEQGYDYRLDRTHFTEYTEEQLKEELLKAGLHIKKQQVKWGEIYVVATH